MGILPFYAIPKELMATTDEQITMCTAGSDAYIPEWRQTRQADGLVHEKQLKNVVPNLIFADPAEIETSLLI